MTSFLYKNASLYEQNGFVLWNDCIPVSKVNKAYKGALDVMNGYYNTGKAPWDFSEVIEGNKIQRVVQIHIANKDIFDLLVSSNIGLLTAKTMSAKRVQVGFSQLNYKPPFCKYDGVVGFHRDSDYVAVFASGSVNVWIPLVDMNFEMGPLLYVNKSHKWIDKLRYAQLECQDIEKQRELLLCEIEEKELMWSETVSVMKTGSIAFHSPHCLHGSYGNISSKGRYVLCLSLFTDQVKFNGNEAEARKMLEDKDTFPIIYQE